MNNGCARTEVTQTFFNPNDVDLEAVYRFPLPKSASLSEVTLTMSEHEIDGEVVERGRAGTIYESEKQAGTDEVAASFWNPVHDQVEGTFSAEIELKSSWPIADVRLPGFENETITDKLEVAVAVGTVREVERFLPSSQSY